MEETTLTCEGCSNGLAAHCQVSDLLLHSSGLQLLRGSSLRLQGCTHRLQSGAFCRLQPTESARVCFLSGKENLKRFQHS